MENPESTLVIVIDKSIKEDFWERAQNKQKILFRQAPDFPFKPIGYFEHPSLAPYFFLSKLDPPNYKIPGLFDKPDESVAGLENSDLILLLRTRGGFEYIAEEISNVASHLRSKMRRVITFGAGEVASAGAELFLLGDERYLSPDGKLFFHLSDLATRRDKLSKKVRKTERKKEWTELTTLLTAFTDDSEKQKEILQLMQRAREKTKDRSITFSSGQASHYGFSRFPPQTTLRELFEITVQTDLSKYVGTQIDSFFSK